MHVRMYNLKLMCFSFKSPLDSTLPGDGIKVPLTSKKYNEINQLTRVNAHSYTYEWTLLCDQICEWVSYTWIRF